jgi:hypothetical protein
MLMMMSATAVMTVVVVVAAATVMVVFMMVAAATVMVVFMMVATAAIMVVFMMVATATVVIVFMMVTAATVVIVIMMVAAAAVMIVIMMVRMLFFLGTDDHFPFHLPGQFCQFRNQPVRVFCRQPQLFGGEGNDRFFHRPMGIEEFLNLSRAVGAVQILDPIYLSGHRNPSCFCFNI